MFRKGTIMGKSSKPSYSSGTVRVNGQTKASTYKSGSNVITDYNMSDAEKRAYDYAQKSFADSLSQVNVFDNETKQNLQKQLNAYAQKGQKLINDMYTPMIDNLKTDIASRFGNFDNSVFLDNLNSIESKRADSMSGLAQDILAQQSNLIDEEMSRRYNYLGFLQDIQNQVNSNILSFSGLSQQNSNSGTNYNIQTQNKSVSDLFSQYGNLAASMYSNFV